jgi:hypothetical protein
LLQLRLQVWPGDRLGAILFDGVKPAIEFGLLRLTQWQVMLLQTVPELCDEREALCWGQANNFVKLWVSPCSKGTRKDRGAAMT